LWKIWQGSYRWIVGQIPKPWLNVHIGCDLPRQHSTSNVVGDDNCSGLITQLFSEPCPKKDMFCFIMLGTNFYQDRVSVGAWLCMAQQSSP
jgi:hypothetical protein